MEKDLLISGIICEFNPLHNGHRHILGQMHKNGLVVCVMSGNFVQRGEPAILDKWTRTQLALENGADLVLELPLPFATANAETFAMGGIGILNALHCTDELWCGSECGDMTSLKRISNLL
ncbi:MAG: nucleotidyltransferase family protein, partial [Oscillospiraceae bacterium]